MWVYKMGLKVMPWCGTTYQAEGVKHWNLIILFSQIMIGWKCVATQCKAILIARFVYGK